MDNIAEEEKSLVSVVSNESCRKSHHPDNFLLPIQNSMS